VRVLVPSAEFAHRFGRKPRSVSDALYRGSDLPPVIKVGGRLYFAQTDIDDWLDEKRQEAIAEKAERLRAATRPVDRTRPSSKHRIVESRERPASDGNGRSLSNTAGSKGVSDV
jgi:hypothetical protein